MDNFERKIRLKDVEVWEVRTSGQQYTLVISDEFRPATLKDLNMPDLLIDEDDQRANTVFTTYFSDEPVKNEHIQPLLAFADMLTSHLALAHCHVIPAFHQENTQKAVDRILLAKCGFKESDIPLAKLWHLNQD